VKVTPIGSIHLATHLEQYSRPAPAVKFIGLSTGTIDISKLDDEISTSRCILYNILIVKIVKPDDGR
jgi:hypothetical protein